MQDLQTKLKQLGHFNITGKFNYTQTANTFSLEVKANGISIELSNHKLDNLSDGLELVKEHIGDSEFELIRQEVFSK